MTIEATIANVVKELKEVRELNEKLEAAIAKGGATAELKEQIARYDASIDKLQKQLDEATAQQQLAQKRMDDFEAERDRLGPSAKKAADAVKQQHYDTWIKWLREKTPVHGETAAKLAEVEKKAVSVGTASAGGYAVPEILVGKIQDQAFLTSAVRQLVRQINVGNTDVRVLVGVHGANAGWVGETGTRNATNTPLLRERIPTFGTLYSYVSMTEESMNDISFDVGAWVAEDVAKGFAKAEGIALLTGSGSNQPTGMLYGAPVTTNDDASPERAHGVLEYVPMNPGASPTTAVIQTDAIFDLIYLLRSPYRMNAKFCVNSLTTSALRKLKDSYGQYLWQPALQAGQPASLAGYPVVTWEDLADYSTVNNLPILFGDFNAGYVLCDVQGMRTTVDDNITTPGYVKLYFRRRMGGIVLDNYAIKVGKMTSA